MAVDVLVAHGALETTDVALTKVARNNLDPVRQGFITRHIGIHIALLTT